MTRMKLSHIKSLPNCLLAGWPLIWMSDLSIYFIRWFIWTFWVLVSSSVSQWVKVTQSCLTLCDPMKYSPSGSHLSLGFSRQEYWSGLLFPSPGDFPKPGVEPSSPVLFSFSFASFWSLPYWGLWGLCVCVTASTIPLHFNLACIWKTKTGKHLKETRDSQRNKLDLLFL